MKDDYEVHQMRLAVAATAAGFTDVIADRAEIVAHPRGERLVEGTFNRRARADGNTVGLRHDRGRGRARVHPALDPQRRSGERR